MGVLNNPSDMTQAMGRRHSTIGIAGSMGTPSGTDDEDFGRVSTQSGGEKGSDGGSDGRGTVVVGSSRDYDMFSLDMYSYMKNSGSNLNQRSSQFDSHSHSHPGKPRMHRGRRHSLQIITDYQKVWHKTINTCMAIHISACRIVYVSSCECASIYAYTSQNRYL